MNKINKERRAEREMLAPLCKFPGITRKQYDANMVAIKQLCQPVLRLIPGLLPNGMPDIAALMRRKGLAGAGAPQLVDAGMYRPVARPRTQAREMARRVRQMEA